MTGFLRRVEFHYARAIHAQLKTLILQHVLPKWLSFPSITVASRNICVRLPRTADTLQLPPPFTNPPPTPPPAPTPPPWLEAFHHSAQTLRVPGLWKHSQNVLFCAIETPAWKIPAASISLLQAATPNCFCCKILRHKRDTPANATLERAGGSGLPAFRAITSHQCVSFL